MKNAHLRFGWLTYVKSTEKTTTSIKLRLDRFIGEVFAGSPEYRNGLTGVLANWTRIKRLSVLSVSDVLRCWSKARKSSFSPG